MLTVNERTVGRNPDMASRQKNKEVRILFAKCRTVELY